jgi:hypothetical protein
MPSLPSSVLSSPASTLARISAAQLVAGSVGQAVALRRRLPYDVNVLGLHGRPENVARDSVLMGTALSAPIVMLSTQAYATFRLTQRPDRAAQRTLGVLGTMMVGGYLGERIVRQRLRRGGWDPVETSIAVAGLSLAAVMATLGNRPERPAPSSVG